MLWSVEKVMLKKDNWAIKDPRFTITFEKWINIKKDNNIKFIQVRRETDGVLNSHIKRFGKECINHIDDFKSYHDMWIDKSNALVDKYGGITINYEDLIEKDTKKLDDFIEGKVDKNIIISKKI